jgi:hypothetical protein
VNVDHIKATVLLLHQPSSRFSSADVSNQVLKHPARKPEGHSPKQRADNARFSDRCHLQLLRELRPIVAVYIAHKDDIVTGSCELTG